MPKYVDTTMLLNGGYRLIKLLNGGSMAMIENNITCKRMLYIKLVISRKWLSIEWL